MRGRGNELPGDFTERDFGIRVANGYRVVIEKKSGVVVGRRRRETSVAIADGIRICSGDPDQQSGDRIQGL